MRNPREADNDSDAQGGMPPPALKFERSAETKTPRPHLLAGASRCFLWSKGSTP